jgi:hypothetical protein
MLPTRAVAPLIEEYVLVPKRYSPRYCTSLLCSTLRIPQTFPKHHEDYETANTFARFLYHIAEKVKRHLQQLYIYPFSASIQDFHVRALAFAPL